MKILKISLTTYYSCVYINYFKGEFPGREPSGINSKNLGIFPATETKQL